MSGDFAGALGERVTLARPVPERDALGGWTGGWATIGSVWALVERDGVGPAAAADARDAGARWRVTMRARLLLVGDRIGWGAATLLVRDVRRDPAAPDRIVAIAEEQR